MSGKHEPFNYPLVSGSLPVADVQEKANMFVGRLETVFKRHEGPEYSEQHKKKIHLAYNRIRKKKRALGHESALISEEDIRSFLVAQKSAPGCDGITWTVLSRLSNQAVSKLAEIYNHCLSLEYFPGIWKHAKIIMIKKHGKDPTLTASYRPISLRNTLGKALEKLILQQVNRELEAKQIIPEYQFGFRRGRSTTDAIIKLHNTARNAVNNSKCALAVMLDIQAAYDSLWTEALVVKLNEKGFPRQLTGIIDSFLRNRTAYVDIAGTVSRTFNISADLPQGAVFSPTLYNIYSADMPVTRQITNLQYADDTALITTSNTELGAANNMQLALNKLYRWATKWRDKVNPEKTQAILFHRRRFRRKRAIEIRDAVTSYNGTRITPQPTATKNKGV